MNTPHECLCRDNGNHRYPRPRALASYQGSRARYRKCLFIVDTVTMVTCVAIGSRNAETKVSVSISLLYSQCVCAGVEAAPDDAAANAAVVVVAGAGHPSLVTSLVKSRV